MRQRQIVTLLLALFIMGYTGILVSPIYSQENQLPASPADLSETEQHRTIEQITERIRGYYAIGQYKRVLEECEKLYTIDPDNAVANLYKVLAEDKIDETAIAEELGTTTSIGSLPSLGSIPSTTDRVPETTSYETKPTPRTYTPEPILPPTGTGRRSGILRSGPLIPILLAAIAALIVVVFFTFIRLKSSKRIKERVSEMEQQVRQSMREQPREKPSTLKTGPTMDTWGGGDQIVDVLSTSDKIEEKGTPTEEPEEIHKEAVTSEEPVSPAFPTAETEEEPSEEKEAISSLFFETPASKPEESESAPFFASLLQEESGEEKKRDEKIEEPVEEEKLSPFEQQFEQKPEVPGTIQEERVVDNGLIELALPGDKLAEESADISAMAQIDDFMNGLEQEEQKEEKSTEDTSSGMTQFSQEFDRLVLSDVGQEDTIISDRLSLDETLIDERGKPPKEKEESELLELKFKEAEEEQPKHEGVANLPFDESETIILTPEHLEEKQTLAQSKPKADTAKPPLPEPTPEESLPPENLRKRTRTDSEDEVFERIDLAGLSEVQADYETPVPKQESKVPDKMEHRQETLFQDQYKRGCEAIDNGDWKKAIHYLTIAQALRPDDRETKTKLQFARQKRQEDESQAK